MAVETIETTTEKSLKVAYKSEIKRIKLWECEPWKNGEYHNPRSVDGTLNSDNIVRDLKTTKLWSPAEIDGVPQYPIVYPIGEGKYEILRGHRRHDALNKLFKDFTSGNGNLVDVKDESGKSILVDGVECRVVVSKLTLTDKLAIVADPTDTRKQELSVPEKFNLFRQLRKAGYSTKQAYKACDYKSSNPLFSNLWTLGAPAQDAWMESYKPGKKLVTPTDVADALKLLTEQKKTAPGKVDLPKPLIEKIEAWKTGKPQPKAKPISVGELKEQIIDRLARENGPKDIIEILALTIGREYDAKARETRIIVNNDDKANEALARLIKITDTILKPAAK